MKNLKIKTLDSSKPILWIKADEPEGKEEVSGDMIRFMQDMDKFLQSYGHSFTILHTPNKYDLKMLSYEELLELLSPEAMNDIGYVRKEVLYIILMAVGNPVLIPEGAEDYIYANTDKFKVSWLKKGEGRYIAIQKIDDKEEEKEE